MSMRNFDYKKLDKLAKLEDRKQQKGNKTQE